MQRYASVIAILPQNIAKYEEIHAAVWPGVLQQISKSNITNYSIYRHGNLLFSYYEYVGDDYDADMKAMAEDPTTRQWWDLCEPLQVPLADRNVGDWWKPIPEIFHAE